MKPKTERNWLIKSAAYGAEDFTADSTTQQAFSRSQKVFSLLRMHPRQEQKKLQLNTFLLQEGYKKQAQVSSHQVASLGYFYFRDQKV